MAVGAPVEGRTVEETGVAETTVEATGAAVREAARVAKGGGEG